MLQKQIDSKIGNEIDINIIKNSYKIKRDISLTIIFIEC